MKKILIILTSLFAVSSLAACGPKGGTSSSSGSTSTSGTPGAQWPTEDVAELVEKLVPGSTTVIPACEGAGSYEVCDYIDEAVAFAVDMTYTSGAHSAMADYATMIEGLGWTYVGTDSYSYDWYAAPAEDLVVEIAADDTLFEIYVEPYEAPAHEWPTEGVAALVEKLVPGSTTVIPAVTGADGYVLNDAIEVFQVFTIDMTYASGAYSAMANYATMIEGLGWTYVKTDSYDYDWYASPAQDLVAEIAADDTLFEIYVEPYEAPAQEWPTEGVAELVEKLVPGSTTVIPAVTGADGYVLNDAIEVFQVFTIDMTYASGAEDAKEAYATMIEGLGWTYVKTDSYYYDWYASPAQDLVAEIAANDTLFEIYVEPYEAPAQEWPTEGVAALVEKLVPGSTTVIPACEGAGSYEVRDYIDEVEAFAVDMTYTSGADSAMADYATMIEGLGWTYVKTDSYGYDWYAAPAEDLVVEIAANDTLFEIYVEPFQSPVTEWPTEELQSTLLNSLGITTIIPAYEGFTNYEVIDYSFLSSVLVTFEGGATVEGYAKILEDAGWEVKIEDGHGYAVDPLEETQVDFEVIYEGDPDEYFMIAIGTYIDQSYTYEGTEWPAAQVDRFLDEYCEGSTANIPQCNGSYYESELFDYYGMNYIITVYEANVDQFRTDLESAGFSLVNDYGQSCTFCDETGSLYVDVIFSQTEYAEIWIYYLTF